MQSPGCPHRRFYLLNSEVAVSALDSGTATYVPSNIQRRLMKTYGVLARVKWDDNKHKDLSRKIRNPFDGEICCDRVIVWMAFKVDATL